MVNEENLQKAKFKIETEESMIGFNNYQLWVSFLNIKFKIVRLEFEFIFLIHK